MENNIKSCRKITSLKRSGTEEYVAMIQTGSKTIRNFVFDYKLICSVKFCSDTFYVSKYGGQKKEIMTFNMQQLKKTDFLQLHETKMS